jgi:hypothetical protein
MRRAIGCSAPWRRPVASKSSRILSRSSSSLVTSFARRAGLLRHAYFPQGAVLSLLTALEDGSAIETANEVLDLIEKNYQVQERWGQLALGWRARFPLWQSMTSPARGKCRCEARLSTSPANCMQSDAMRKHSSSCLSRSSGPGTAPLVKTPMPEHCTAACFLSVVYTTEQ